MNEYKITAGNLKLQNGTLVLRTPTDIMADEIEQKKALEEEAKKRADKAKTNRERQNEFRTKRRAQGWKQDWIPPSILEAAQELGGLEQLANDRAALLQTLAERDKRISELEQALESLRKPRKWWQFW